MRTCFRALFASSTVFFSCAAYALEKPMELEDCAAIAGDRERLACFDALAASRMPGREESPTQAEALPALPASTPPATAAVAEAPPQKEASFLADHWELEPEYTRRLFHFRPHRENYLIASYNPDPNNAPYRPFRSFTGTQGLSEAELHFQIGFKLKFAENVADKPIDLWFGYTQQSFWQASNRQASSPFRETNYQPEVMAVLPLHFELLGVRARFINLGFVHESNGQSSTLSRSWNRVYLQTGIERGKFTMLARVWKRINEDREEDDNPDILDYMGHGDLLGTYRNNGHEYSVLARYNFHTDKGAVQLGWAFPIASKLKGYVQFFSGYGQSLIDYNYSQRTIGLGVLVTY